jgi:hypothetical protein
MKYKITPLNIFSLLMIAYAIRSGYVMSVYLIPIALLGLLLDFIIQALTIKYIWKTIAGLIIIIIFLISNTYL